MDSVDLAFSWPCCLDKATWDSIKLQLFSNYCFKSNLCFHLLSCYRQI